MTNKSRLVQSVVPASRTLEGGGFEVFRPFPTADLDLVDPFLLLDEMAPKVHQPGQMKGAPDHPHRGFETVTFMVDGEMEQRDAAVNFVGDPLVTHVEAFRWQPAVQLVSRIDALDTIAKCQNHRCERLKPTSTACAMDEKSTSVVSGSKMPENR